MEEDYGELAESTIGSFNVNDRPDVRDIKHSAKHLIREIEQACPEGRSRSLAITHIETAAMFAVKSLFEG